MLGQKIHRIAELFEGNQSRLEAFEAGSYQSTVLYACDNVSSTFVFDCCGDGYSRNRLYPVNLLSEFANDFRCFSVEGALPNEDAFQFINRFQRFGELGVNTSGFPFSVQKFDVVENVFRRVQGFAFENECVPVSVRPLLTCCCHKSKRTTNKAEKASGKRFPTDVKLAAINRACEKGRPNRSCEWNAIQPIFKLAHRLISSAVLIRALLGGGCLPRSSYLKGVA